VAILNPFARAPLSRGYLSFLNEYWVEGNLLHRRLVVPARSSDISLLARVNVIATSIGNVSKCRRPQNKELAERLTPTYSCRVARPGSS